MEQPPKTVKHSFKAVWIGILGICAAPIALPDRTFFDLCDRSRVLFLFSVCLQACFLRRLRWRELR